jgi:GMP synthase-like glutamine amidotransferase
MAGVSSDEVRGIVLQMQDTAPPGLLGEWARTRGIALDVVDAAGGDLPPAGRRDAAFAIVLGSAASLVHDTPPWAARLLVWLRRADAACLPVLGICFGAQALSAALGGAVHRLATPEIGWVRVATADAERVPAGPWMSWHEDGLTPPPLAYELASNAAGTQAFCLRRHLAVQFHPEVTTEIVDGWTRFPDARLRDAGTTAEQLLAACEANAAAAPARAQRLFDGFAARAGVVAQVAS